MYFESIIAMVAVAVWSLSGSGLVHSAAQYVVVLSTIVTIGFNINPLMKYDGYFVVSDLLGRPNLRSEAIQQLQTHLKWMFLGLRTPPRSRSRLGRLLLSGFGIATVSYKTLVLLGISMIIATKIPAIGLVVAVVFAGSTLWQLTAKLVRYLLTSPEVRSVWYRACISVALVVCGIIGLLLFVPVPGRVRAVGTLACKEDRTIRARSSGFLARESDCVGETVKSGTLLGTLENIDIVSAVQKKRAKIDQLQVRLHYEISDNRRAAAATQEKISKAYRELDQLRRDRDGLEVRSPIRGRITRADGLRHEGRFIRKGEPLAIVSAGPWIVTAVANSQDLTYSPPKVGQQVAVRLAGKGRDTLQGTVVRIARAGSRKIADPALTQVGGGQIAVSPDTLEAEEPFFRVTILLDKHTDRPLRHGMTAFVIFGGKRPTIGTYLHRHGLLLLNKLRSAG